MSLASLFLVKAQVMSFFRVKRKEGKMFKYGNWKFLKNLFSILRNFNFNFNNKKKGEKNYY